MALIVEDGSGLANSQSYVSEEDAREYAAGRGVELPADDSAISPMLISAMDYLEAQRARFQGTKTHPGVQALQWPRTGVTLDCSYLLPGDVIPVELKSAQMALALEVFAGRTLMPSSDGRAVKREKVDVIEREFMTATDLGQGGLPVPVFPAVDALLAPLFDACGPKGFRLRTVRV